MGAQALVEGMSMDERFELRHEVVVMAEGELEVYPPLDSCLAEPLETLDLALREVVVGEVGECRPAPTVSIASGPSCLRRLETYPCRALAAVPGGLPAHNSSISRSLETNSLSCKSRIASSFRCCPPRSATSVAPSRIS